MAEREADLIGPNQTPPQKKPRPQLVVLPEETYYREDQYWRMDITRFKVIDWLFRQRWWQFMTILPNQIVFWTVIYAGLFGTSAPNANIASALTWYVWFGLVFFMMLGVGRLWCLMCPFGGFGEWIQRLAFWSKRKVNFTLGKHWPAKWANVMPSIIFFIILTWGEEFYNIAGPGDPKFTGYLVMLIIASAVVVFLVYERRTFCRYLCPLTGIIGVMSAMSAFDGFRSKDREKCLDCRTKECMKGSAQSYGCPWWEHPGSQSSNFMCGLCTECYKGCPSNNISLSMRTPFADTWVPSKKRWDYALSVPLLWGVVWFQMFNALASFSAYDPWLSKVTGWLSVAQVFWSKSNGYPMPLDYAFFTLLPVGILVLAAKLASSLTRNAEGWRRLFTNYAFGFIPLVGSLYLARQLPKLLYNSPLVLPDISNPFGWNWNLVGTSHWNTTNIHIETLHGVVITQVSVVIVGTLVTLYSLYKNSRVDLDFRSAANRMLTLLPMLGVALGSGILSVIVYIQMNGAF